MIGDTGTGTLAPQRKAAVIAVLRHYRDPQTPEAVAASGTRPICHFPFVRPVNQIRLTLRQRRSKIPSPFPSSPLIQGDTNQQEEECQNIRVFPQTPVFLPSF